MAVITPLTAEREVQMKRNEHLQNRIDAFLERKTAKYPEIDRYAQHITEAREAADQS